MQRSATCSSVRYTRCRSKRILPTKFDLTQGYRMKKPDIFRLGAIACAASLALAPLGARAADAVAKVNGKEIPQSRMDFVIKANAGQGQPDSPDLRNRVREALIRNELLAQEAAKKPPSTSLKSTSASRKRSSTRTCRIT